MTSVYSELRRVAARMMATERPHTLQATAVVHEAWLRLSRNEAGWNGPAHFVASAARAVRHVLVDHARRRQRECRGGFAGRVSLDVADPVAPESSTLIALDDALGRLATEDPLKARIVELRFFAGLGADETASALEISRSTLAREWRFARAWLRVAVADGGER